MSKDRTFKDLNKLWQNLYRCSKGKIDFDLLSQVLKDSIDIANKTSRLYTFSKNIKESLEKDSEDQGVSGS